MDVQIICVGKIKEKYLINGIKEYVKRLSKYTKVTIVEVNDVMAPENLSLAEQEIVKEKEAEKLKKQIKDSYVIALALEGKMLDSVAFAKEIEKIQTYHSSRITFLIGGSLGLSNTLLKEANYLLSFSIMTFPHQLMRLILLEQIYRSFRILNNEPYHK
ncbi:MAG: 23S rRNA (pseudouridine(1915)-N(3))-methyltransferase RlmH [Candidatus Izemoplasmataceae bacterium]